ncbi:MAG: NAD(P)H-hydrate dehydratase [Bacteroidales bacterium]|nr:NAD(P)H-hydrate dehydratase [Clostridium sp.]MCM1203899.1 NAD(P)H-hydrate dehydratase [Bacteroidales bacterium]
MQYIVTKKEMQEVDAYTINRMGIPAAVLMERAAIQVADEVEGLNAKKGRILIVVEGGSNGGDGLAAARILLERGHLVDVYYIGGLKKMSEAFHLQKNILYRMGIRLRKTIPNKEYSVIVDGIFGVGLSRKVEGVQKKTIEVLNQMDAVKVAIDIPSGIDATTGEILGVAFRADYTVTFGLKKLGMFFSDGIDYCGKIICRDIGFPEKAIQQVKPQIYAYDSTDMDRLPKRIDNSNKGTYGKVAVIAGSKNMSGAAFLCGKAAYSAGTGLVKIYTHESNRTIIQSQLPEAVMMTYRDYEGALSCIEDAMKWATVIVVGPGLGVDTTSERMLYELLMNAEVPMVLDADALNILSNNIELLATSSVPVIMTPHMVEMSRLIGKTVAEIAANRFETAKQFAKKLQVTIVLKDAKSIVTNGGEQTYMNLAGNNGMSTGGAGDVLSGIIAGMLAGGLCLEEAARMGTYVHCLAGDIAAEKKGVYAMLASDILASLGEVMR